MRPREGGPFLFAFDFDGTLSPIVESRRAARLHPACRALLAGLSVRKGWFVAVLSSRSIGDLASRVRLKGVLLGGGSGCEWLYPDSRMVGDREGERERLAGSRVALLPLLESCSAHPGVLLEDKGWSAAIHFRGAPSEDRRLLLLRLGELARERAIPMFRGPDAIEIPFSPRATKKEGLERLLSRLRIPPSSGRFAYAGDDENDADALRWVVSHGGAGFSVGARAYSAGCRPVDGPEGLARAVRAFACREEARPPAMRQAGDRRIPGERRNPSWIPSA